MRRSLLLLTTVAVLTISSAAPVTAFRGPNGECSISVDPRMGTPTSVYTIRGEGWPAGTIEDLTVVTVWIERIGSDEGSVTWVWLVPGGTWFFFDYNGPAGPSEPPSTLAVGRYRIHAEDEGHTCSDHATFTVRPQLLRLWPTTGAR